MNLTPNFAVSARNPLVSSYNPADPTAPHMGAMLFAYGSTARPDSYTYPPRPFSFQSQYDNDEIQIGWDPADPNDENDINNYANQLLRKSCIAVTIMPRNVSVNNQHLIIFGFKSIYGSPLIQFFVGTDFVRTEQIDGDDQVAILLDHPGTGIYTIGIYARLASNSYSTIAAFTGANGYIL